MKTITLPKEEYDQMEKSANEIGRNTITIDITQDYFRSGIRIYANNENLKEKIQPYIDTITLSEESEKKYNDLKVKLREMSKKELKKFIRDLKKERIFL